MPYNLLRQKEILAILDGDSEFGEHNGKRVAMPYLSGPTLCSISTTFGLHADYGWNGGALSRWVYLDNLLEYCIAQKKMPQLLAYLFAKDKFSDSLKGLTPKEIDETHNHIVATIIEQISGQLYFGGHEFLIINRQFVVKPINATVKIEAPKLKVIDTEYKRKCNESNLLVIECKGWWSNPCDVEKDRNKIKAFISSDTYRYHFGLLLTFGTEKPDYEWQARNERFFEKVTP